MSLSHLPTVQSILSPASGIWSRYFAETSAIIIIDSCNIYDPALLKSSLLSQNSETKIDRKRIGRIVFVAIDNFLKPGFQFPAHWPLIPSLHRDFIIGNCCGAVTREWLYYYCLSATRFNALLIEEAGLSFELRLSCVIFFGFTQFPLGC